MALKSNQKNKKNMKKNNVKDKKGNKKVINFGA